jgi:REP element-mobilizing transposase RayT
MPEHVHLVIGRHQRNIGRIVGHLKTRSKQELEADGLWPEHQRPAWSDRAWKVFIDSPEHVLAAIRYVEGNPEKEGKPRQRWSFVTPFEF